jgi:hypothetical protein
MNTVHMEGPRTSVLMHLLGRQRLQLVPTTTQVPRSLSRAQTKQLEGFSVLMPIPTATPKTRASQASRAASLALVRELTRNTLPCRHITPHRSTWAKIKLSEAEFLELPE